MTFIAFAASFELNCVMTFSNACHNFDAETSKNNQDKTRVTKINVGDKDRSQVGKFRDHSRKSPFISFFTDRKHNVHEQQNTISSSKLVPAFTKH